MSNPPARCSKKPASFSNWGAASVITKLDVNSKNCCFDIDGDLTVDNAFADVIRFLPGAMPDKEMRNAIINDKLVAILEHQGVSGQPPASPYPVNILRGEPESARSKKFAEYTNGMLSETDGLGFFVHRASFERGVHPNHLIPSVTHRGGRITGGTGEFSVETNATSLVLRTSLDLDVARIEATVATNRTATRQGVALTDGRLGGYIELKSVFDGLDQSLRTCTCLGKPSDAITYTTPGPLDPDIGKAKCTPQVQKRVSKCTNSKRTICRESGTICNFISAFANTSDIDADCDGQLDSLSVGYEFRAASAEIVGTTK